MHALVIDDLGAMRIIVKRMVENLGFETTLAIDGCDALRKMAAATHRFDLALIDWNMPEMNGLEFLHAVRADLRHARMTLMMVTTESEQSHIARALAAGAHEYLIKPFTAEAMAEKLELLGLADPRRHPAGV